MSENEGKDSVLAGLDTRTNDELRELLDHLQEEEQRISYQRRVLHGKIDILRAEMVRRLKGQHGSGADAISGRDIERLAAILAGDALSALSGAVDDDPGPEDEED